MKESSKMWVKAACVLGTDPNKEFLCPECQQCNLAVEDVTFEKDPELFERYLRCPNCKAWNVMRLRRPIPEVKGQI